MPPPERGFAMSRESEHSKAVEAVYAAAVEPAKWPNALGALCRLCAAESASHNLQHIANGTGIRTALGYDRADQPRYHDGFATRNPLFKGLLRQQTDVPHPHQTLVDDEIFRQSYYYNEYCRPNGLHFMAGLVIKRRGEIAEWVSVNRGPRGDPFDRNQLRALGQLAPHLRRASDASYRLTEAHAARKGWEAVLDTLRCGVVMLDQCSHVVFANQTARLLDAARDGLALRPAGVSAPAAGSALARAISLATDGDSSGVRHGAHVVLPRRDLPYPLSVTIIPLPRESSWQLAGAPVALLLIADPAQPAWSDARTLMKLFGLTDREAALTVLLADGYKLDDAALQLGIGRETARTHLARALDKTATERQTDLVRLALAAVPPIAAPQATDPFGSPDVTDGSGTPTAPRQRRRHRKPALEAAKE
jgi:DNA-binding CsgD family transcriptional regulator